MAIKLTMKNIKDLQSIIDNIGNPENSYRSDNATRFSMVDKYIEKSGDRSETAVQVRLKNELGDKTKIGSTEIPTCKTEVETAEAYYAGIFLTGKPIFSAVTSPDREDTATQLNSLTARDEERFEWVSDLLQCLRDVLKYNLCAAKVHWDTINGSSVDTAADGKGAVTTSVYSGNNIDHIDPFNLLYDQTVSPTKVHKKGTHVGYVERINYIELKTRINSWNDENIIKVSLKPILDKETITDLTPSATSLYMKKEVHLFNDLHNKSETNEWASFWGGTAKNNSNKARSDIYEFVELYVRIVPKDYSLGSGMVPAVYLLRWVNGYLIYFEPIENSNGLFPIVIGQLYIESHTAKSFAEYFKDIQDLGTSILTAMLDSLRRNVADRAIYDPARINKADIENPNPSGKIPVKGGLYMNESISDAYYQIPFQDTVSGIVGNLLGFVKQIAMDTAGQNPSSQGQFQKGNKTLFEFDKVMANSEARMLLGGLKLDSTFFAAIKSHLKFNYLMFAEPDTINNKDEKAPVTIDPVAIRKEAPEYAMADGLIPATKLANTDVLVQTLNYLNGDPVAKLEYDTMAIFASAVKQQGVNHLTHYKRTPEQQQEYLQKLGLLTPQEPTGDPNAAS